MSEAPVTVYDPMPVLRVEDVVHQVALVQEVMKSVMKPDEHYGKIPGCGDKPTLLQPGAQVLAFTFRLAPSFDIETKDLPGSHREYVVRCTLVSIAHGQVVGMGVGSATTMESRYRYRNVSDYEITGEKIPDDARERKAEYRKNGFGMKMVDGVWEWVKYGDSGKVENPDIADTYNTVLKIACKRAFIHAVLNATAASDMFTQDIDDLPIPGAAPVAVHKVEDWMLKDLAAIKRGFFTDKTWAEVRAWAQGEPVKKDSDLSLDAAVKILEKYPLPAEKADGKAAPGAEEVPS